MRDKDLEKIITELKEKVAISCHILYKMRLATYMEHVSARIPNQNLLVTNPFMSLKEVRPEDLLLVDFDGNLVDGSNKPRGHILLHIEIFKSRKDCNAVVHTHQVMGLVFGMVEKKLLPLLHVAAPTGSKEIAIFPNPDVILDWEHAREIVKIIGDRDICHIQGHGIEYLGRTVEEATIAAIHLEQQATFNYLASSIGIPKPISEDSILKIIQFEEKDLLPRHWKYYQQMVEQEEAKEKEIISLLREIKSKLDKLG